MRGSTDGTDTLRNGEEAFNHPQILCWDVTGKSPSGFQILRFQGLVKTELLTLNFAK